MSAFIDASALIAILAQEPDWDVHADRVDGEADRLWSPVSRWETIVGFARRQDIPVGDAHQIVVDFGNRYQLRMVDIGADEAELAAGAHGRYGRGSGSKAKLNMGDCFAYACAKANGARLLYKGDDFTHTDLADA